MPPQATVGVRLKIQGRQALKQVKTLGGRINKALGKIRPIAGMLGGVGGVYMLQSLARKTIEFDVALTRLSIQAHKSKDVQADLRKEWIKVATETGIAKEEIGAAGQSIIDATGDFEFMRKVMKDVTVMSQVTGAEMGGLGNVVSDLKNNFNLTGEEAAQMLRVFTEQGEKGKLTLVELAQSGARAFSAMKLAGIDSRDAIKHAGAELQIYRRGFGTAEETTTAYLGTISRLAGMADQLGKKGVKVFDPKDPNKMRALSDILSDVFTKIGTDAETLSELFGIRNVVGVQAMATAFQKAKTEGKDLDDVLSEFNEVKGDPTRFSREMGRMLDTTGGKLMTFQQKLDAIFDEAMMASIDDLAGYLPELTKLIKFLVDNKEAIIAVWGLGKMGAFAPAAAALGGGGAAAVGTAAAAKEAGKAAASKGVGPGGGAAVVQGIGLGLAGSEAGRAFVEKREETRTAAGGLEEMLGRKLTVGERIRVEWATQKKGLGPGGYQEMTQEQTAKIFGDELSRRMEEYTANLNQILVDAVAKGAERGTSKAKITVTPTSPLSAPGGTQGKVVHGFAGTKGM